MGAMKGQKPQDKRVTFGIPVNVPRPILDAMTKQGQIVTVEGARFALNRDSGKTTLHRVTMV